MLDNDVSAKHNPEASLKTAVILSRLCLPLMMIEALIGLFVPGTYLQDGPAGRAMWQGNDAVNLFLFTPLLGLALVLVRRGSDKGKLFWLGIQALVTYNSLYYPLAVAYDRYFLLYVAILGISLFSFLFGLTGIDFSPYEYCLPEKRSRLIASGLMSAFALILSLLWTGLAVYFLFTGETKLTGQAMISTFDLILIVTPVVLATRWLLKGQARGYVVLTMMALMCGLYCFVLMAYTPFALSAHLPDAWKMLPLWILLGILCFPATFVLLRRPRKE